LRIFTCLSALGGMALSYTCDHTVCLPLGLIEIRSWLKGRLTGALQRRGRGGWCGGIGPRC
jgi:hypothetical protein